jgi:hypothetical protein
MVYRRVVRPGIRYWTKYTLRPFGVTFRPKPLSSLSQMKKSLSDACAVSTARFVILTVMGRLLIAETVSSNQIAINQET